MDTRRREAVINLLITELTLPSVITETDEAIQCITTLCSVMAQPQLHCKNLSCEFLSFLLWVSTSITPSWYLWGSSMRILVEQQKTEVIHHLLTSLSAGVYIYFTPRASESRLTYACKAIHKIITWSAIKAWGGSTFINLDITLCSCNSRTVLPNRLITHLNWGPADNPVLMC